MFEILLVAFAIVFLALVVYSIPALIIIGPIPASHRVIKAALELAKIKEGETIHDLGSGDGRVLLDAAKEHNCKGVGYELILPFFLLSKLKVFLSGNNDKIKLHFKNFYKADLSQADVIFCYLIPHGMKKLSDKFKKEPLKKGARIVSFSFKIKDWEPKKVLKLDKNTPNIYLYEI